MISGIWGRSEHYFQGAREQRAPWGLIDNSEGLPWFIVQLIATQLVDNIGNRFLSPLLPIMLYYLKQARGVTPYI